VNILLRADSYRWPSLIASAMPVSCNVTEVLVITEEPSGMRARTASRAASRPSTTSTLNPCSSSATTVAASACSSGSAVYRVAYATDAATTGRALRAKAHAFADLGARHGREDA
jgi:hypothetical protein